MIHPDGIEVFIRPRSYHLEPYKEYEPQGRLPNPNPDHLERYIEAVSGQNYEVVVRALPNYRAYGSTALSWSVQVDNWVPLWYYQNPPFWNNHLPYVTLGVIGNQTLRVDGQWKQVEFTFSSLEIAEQKFDEPEILQEKASMIGRIRVMVQRGFAAPLPNAQPWYNGRRDTVSGEFLDGQGSTKLVKQKGISHQTSMANSTPVAPPKNTWQFAELGGQHGKEYTFDFRYRSRMRLEIMKLIQVEGQQVARAAEPVTIDLTEDNDDNEIVEPPPHFLPKRKLEDVTLSDTEEDETVQAARDARRLQQLEEERRRIEGRQARRAVKKRKP